ncbi:prenyltransferase/squalene oxidase repeat-containing protein [Bacillus carboniphilus]|uniref:Prenyltransferase/squalene oxidase repeat-containing protein n=1 Tax=Bacillus carboniphilus TaxID=86663 RepID=A0ABY9JRZ1_9BACI|nr:prenyltransferase/squalene oxidase repeat-containing protein [Bacillus carboniphilus]WLR42174.1 prenyltransferase/squalene oxidase repeat-containing protein [Bacillus carboniphilus]
MIDQDRLLVEMRRRVKEIQSKQSSNGAWYLCCDSGVLYNAFFLITLRSVRDQDEKFIKNLAEYIYSKQNDNGAWKLYEDESPGNITTTASAYNALLYSGYFKKSDLNMKKAEQQILSMGGIEKVHFLAKGLFSVNGQYNWKLPVPIYTILLPQYAPLNFFDLSCYARVHFAPLMVFANLNYSIQTEFTPDLSNLIISSRNIKKSSPSNIKRLKNPIRKKALLQLEKFMIDRTEEDGTLYNYASATILMIYSLLALGYHRKDRIIRKPIESLKKYACDLKGYKVIQNTPSTNWDTALLSYSLQELAVPEADLTIKKSVDYLVNQQHMKKTDWSIHNQNVLPGGWGFAEENTKHPDIDDTTAALRALNHQSKKDPEIDRIWKKGLHWVISMQNDDGGWAAFEKNVDHFFIARLPIENVKDGALDASSADLTGRTLEFLGNYAGYKKDDFPIMKAIKWLIRNQEKDGSWYGKWGVSYIYGTWTAITGLCAVGMSIDNPCVRKANDWLLSIQQTDGGWGESCSSSVNRKYKSLSNSTVSQTAWALDSLIAIHPTPTNEIEKGIQLLLRNTLNNSYPTGTGFPNLTYFRYYSYQEIYPLLTLSHYYHKYIKP